VNAAFDGLSRALQQSLAGGLSSNEDLQVAVSNVAWQHMPSLATRLPPEQRTLFAQYRTEVRNLLHDLRAPASAQAPHLRQQQLATALALHKQWDVWQDLAETSYPVSSWLQVWWDRSKLCILTGGTVCGVFWYFFLRAVGDLQVDATSILVPAPADVLFATAATPSDNATLKQRREQYLRDFRDWFFGNRWSEDQSGPLLVGLRQSLKTPFLNEVDNLDADMTPTQRVYDRLGQLSAERAMVFVVHVSNHSPRGARPVGELRTRLTYLERLQFPWRKLDVAANLRCEARDQDLYLELVSDAPAINVRATVKGSTGERLSALNERCLWKHPIRWSLASQRRLWVVRFDDDDTLRERQPAFSIRDSRDFILDTEIATSREEALQLNKPYFTERRARVPGAECSEPALLFALPRNRKDLEQWGAVVEALEVELQWEDLLGDHHSRTECVRAPVGTMFFQLDRLPDSRDEEIIEITSRTSPVTESRFMTAAVDTLDRSGSINFKDFLLNRIGFSGRDLQPGNSLEHVTHLHANLAPGGILLIAGRVEQCPPGKYQLEIWLDNRPLAIEPDSSSSKTAKVFISLPLEKFDPRNLDEILSRFRAPDGVDVKNPTDLRNERSL
jgi:hypothetical protein